ncbi:hypothetical protein SLS60_000337 [Paraconiothyrium brasiliense]|uniref:Uncharacterized protein n=1 Tax=Paraconiothyrium brasiliense TaxID=300254 RepID=A0ABR3S5Y8_9PLEO
MGTAAATTSSQWFTSHSKRKGKTKMPKNPHPNPSPARQPHPSSLASLCDYIDHQVLYLRSHYHDEEMEFFRAEHSSVCPAQHFSSATISRKQDPFPTSSCSDPSSSTIPSSSRHPDPDTCTAGWYFFSRNPCPLVPSQREAIEEYIPPAVLQLPLVFKLGGLRAWHEKLQLHELKRVGIAPRKREWKAGKPRSNVLPWDEGIEDWNGSFPSEAIEVVKVGGSGDDSGEEVVHRTVPRRKNCGRRKAGAEGKRERSVPCFDMDDGHVLGRDWACWIDGPIMLLHEQKVDDEDGDAVKERKVSVRDKVVHVLKRALS